MSSTASGHSKGGGDNGGGNGGGKRHIKDKDRGKTSSKSKVHDGGSGGSSSKSRGRAESDAASASGGSGGTRGKGAAPVVTILSATNTWKRDVRPDKKNSQYHSLYSGDVASYRRGTNSCIGLGKGWLRWDDGTYAVQ